MQRGSEPQQHMPERANTATWATAAPWGSDSVPVLGWTEKQSACPHAERHSAPKRRDFNTGHDADEP